MRRYHGVSQVDQAVLQRECLARRTRVAEAGSSSARQRGRVPQGIDDRRGSPSSRPVAEGLVCQGLRSGQVDDTAVRTPPSRPGTALADPRRSVPDEPQTAGAVAFGSRADRHDLRDVRSAVPGSDRHTSSPDSFENAEAPRHGDASACRRSATIGEFVSRDDDVTRAVRRAGADVEHARPLEPLACLGSLARLEDDPRRDAEPDQDVRWTVGARPSSAPRARSRVVTDRATTGPVTE